MKYSKTLKELFAGITLNAEDLLFLETFQITYLPDRVPKKEFAALLRAYPFIHRYLVSKYSPIEDFINAVLKENKPIKEISTIDKYCQELLWEIAELIVYNKYPEVYDAKTRLNWKITDITSIASLKGKVVIDAGAGTGRLAFMAAPYAKTVYAIEPASGFRRFIREKAKQEKVENLYPLDGFLDSIPLPDNSADILMTSNAIGWNLEAELKEIERVVKPDGSAIHATHPVRASDGKAGNPFHEVLTSPPWNYVYSESRDTNGLKMKYHKIIK